MFMLECTWVVFWLLNNSQTNTISPAKRGSSDPNGKIPLFPSHLVSHNLVLSLTSFLSQPVLWSPLSRPDPDSVSHSFPEEVLPSSPQINQVIKDRPPSSPAQVQAFQLVSHQILSYHFYNL